MPYTGHGHHIPGTTRDSVEPSGVARCGGVNMCPRCKQDAKEYREVVMKARPDQELNWLVKAESQVRRYISNSYTLTPDAKLDYELSIAWTVVTPTMKKVLFRTSIDDVLYRVTFIADDDLENGEQLIIEPIKKNPSYDSRAYPSG